MPHDIYHQAVRQMFSMVFQTLFILRELRLLFSFRKRDRLFLFTYGLRALRQILNLTRQYGVQQTIASTITKINA